MKFKYNFLYVYKIPNVSYHTNGKVIEVFPLEIQLKTRILFMTVPTQHCTRSMSAIR